MYEIFSDPVSALFSFLTQCFFSLFHFVFPFFKSQGNEPSQKNSFTSTSLRVRQSISIVALLVLVGFFVYRVFFSFPPLCKHEKAVLLSIQLRFSVHSLHQVFSPTSMFHPKDSGNIINGLVYVADQLVEKGYVDKEGNGYVVTAKGRRYIKRNIEFYERNELLSTYNLKDPALAGGGR